MIQIFNSNYPLRNSAFFLFEGGLILGSILAATAIRSATSGLPLLELKPVILKALFVAGIFQLSFYFNDLYDFKVARNSWEFGTRLVRALGISIIVLAMLLHFFPVIRIGEHVFLMTLAVMVVLLACWRVLFWWLAQKRGFNERVLILGSGELGTDVLKQVQLHPALGYELRGFVEGLEGPLEEPAGFRKLGSVEQLLEIVRREKIGKVVVALGDRRGNLPVKELMECKLQGIEVEEASTFLEHLTGKIFLKELRPSWIIFSQGFKHGKLRTASKRLLELMVALGGLIVSLPVIAMVIPLIKLDSPGPVFYSQERIGQNGKRFTLRKFRTMRSDAESKTGPAWAQENDSRVTRLGRLLRRTRIDEIPQIYSVLKGDMSFVGPRPERPFFVKRLEERIPYYRQRLVVKPGITGWAQIKYHYGASDEDALEKLQYDLYYIKNMSVALDMSIMFDTLKVIASSKGAR